MASQTSGKTKLFISYSRKDRGRIERLYDALASEEDLRVFRDTDDILPTEEWKPRLEKLIRESDTIIFALSPASAASEVCAWELELAASLNKRIIPIVVENVDGAVPEAVSKLNYIFLTEADDFGRGLTKIQDAISLDIDWVREHTRLGELADRWEKAVRLGAQPLRGKELEAAERWLVEQPKNAPQPTELQRRYILESRKAATRRARITVMGSIAAMLIVGVLGVFAWVQRNVAVDQKEAAQKNESIALIEKAQRAFEVGDYATAMQHSYAALPHDDGLSDRPVLDIAEKLLREAFARNQTVKTFAQAHIDKFSAYDQFFSIGEDYIGLKSLHGLDVFRATDDFAPTLVSLDPWLNANAYPCTVNDEVLVINLAPRRTDSLGPEGGFRHEGPGIALFNTKTLGVQTFPLDGEISFMECLKAENKVVFITKGSVTGVIDLAHRVEGELGKIAQPELAWVQFPAENSEGEVLQNQVPDWLKDSLVITPQENTYNDVTAPQLSEAHRLERPRKNSASIQSLFVPENGEGTFVLGVRAPHGGPQFCTVPVEGPNAGKQIICTPTLADFDNIGKQLVNNGTEVVDVINARVYSVTDRASRELPFKSISGSLRPTFRYLEQEFVVGFDDRDLVIAGLSDLIVIHRETFAPAAEDISPNNSVRFETLFDEVSGLLALDVGQTLTVYDAANGFQKLWSSELPRDNTVGKMFFSKDGAELFTTHDGSSYLETRDARTGQKRARAFVGEAEYTKDQQNSAAFAQNADGDQVANITSGGTFRITQPLPEGFSDNAMPLFHSIDTAIYSKHMGGFIASNYQGLHLIDTIAPLQVIGGDIHGQAVVDQMMLTTGGTDPIFTPQKIRDENRFGNAWITPLDGTDKDDKFLSYGVSGPAYIWSLRGEDLQGTPLEFDERTRRINDGEPWRVPNVKTVSLSPSGDQLAMIVSGHDSVCVYDLPSRSLLFCTAEGEYYSLHWRDNQTLEMIHNGIDGPTLSSVTFSGTEYNSIETVLESNRIGAVRNGQYIGTNIKDENFRYVSEMWLTLDETKVPVQVPVTINFFVKWDDLFFLDAVSLAVQGGFIALPIELDVDRNLREQRQIVFVEAATGKSSCVYPLEIDSRPTYGSNVLNHVPDSSLFVIGPRAQLVDVKTCTLLEELNSTVRNARAAGFEGNDVKLLLSDGTVLTRSVRAPLGTIIRAAGDALGALQH